MVKKYGIVTIFCLSLLVIAGCGKSGTTGISDNLQTCQSVCDQQAVMYKDQATNYKTSCYSNCDKIDAGSKANGGNADQIVGDLNNEETTSTDEEVMTDENCDIMCHGALWIQATAEEKDGCMVSCKAEVRVQSKDINDCNNIESDSDGLITEYSCIATKAVAQKNPGFCAEVAETNDRDSCYIAVAQTLTDKSICDKVSSEENKTYCNMIFTQE